VAAARELALQSGLSWELFYQYTPYQTTIITRAWAKQKRLDSRNLMIAAYHNANLSLYTNDPKLFPPTFEDWYGGGKKKSNVQSKEEFGASLMLWAMRDDKENKRNEADGA
jgi:hypothetical protein